ncbi:MAG: hypothetical protein M1819_000557 [Sarea resinae]|nr:MAG: hypothetical protein M1819_000557 [Sarea resinae]
MATQSSANDQRTPQDIQSSQSLVLDLPPSCLEFCPADPRYFVVGTYYLENPEGASKVAEDLAENGDKTSHPEKKPQHRRGSLVLFRLQDDQMILVDTVHTSSAVLDLHFSPHQPSLLAIGTSTSSISLYELKSTAESAALVHIKTMQSFPTSLLVLALAFHPVYPDVVGASLSNGEIAFVRLESSQSLSTTSGEPAYEDFTPHSLEAWTLAFSRDGRAVFSGGDDSILNFKELAGEDGSEITGSTWSDRKTHGAGVTAILPLPTTRTASKEILLTGSYDDHVRVYDTGKGPGRPAQCVVAEMNLGGGVWRLKLLRDYSEQQTGLTRVRVLASCMHAGVRILEVSQHTDESWTIEVLARFEEHESMNYGSDVQPPLPGVKADDQAITCVTSSFYDRLLCLWKYEDEQ